MKPGSQKASASPQPSREVLRREYRIIGLIAAVQFVNVLDFVMVMPLGPQFAQALGFPASHLGWIGGSYTAAAAVAGLIASSFLDRFDRKSALLVCLFGLALATIIGGFAWSFPSLLCARILAGIFGGPAGAMTFSIAADATPVERRGRAMGVVMSAFSLASIFGVPAGLELARVGGWRMPFFAVGTLALVVLAVAVKWIPTMRSHLERARQDRVWESTKRLLRSRLVWYGYITMAAGMAAGFLIIPNMAAFFELNLGYPREGLARLYGIGGTASLAFMFLSGRAVDKLGGSLVGILATLGLITMVYLGFFLVPARIAPTLIFVGFMVSMSVRGVATASVASRIPAAHERARFTSLLAVFQHATSAAAAFFSAYLLSQDESGKLAGMPTVATWSMGVSVLIMIFLVALERRLDREGRPKGGLAAVVSTVAAEEA